MGKSRQSGGATFSQPQDAQNNTLTKDDKRFLTAYLNKEYGYIKKQWGQQNILMADLMFELEEIFEKNGLMDDINTIIDTREKTFYEDAYEDAWNYWIQSYQEYEGDRWHDVQQLYFDWQDDYYGDHKERYDGALSNISKKLNISKNDTEKLVKRMSYDFGNSHYSFGNTLGDIKPVYNSNYREDKAKEEVSKRITDYFRG